MSAQPKLTGEKRTQCPSCGQLIPTQQELTQPGEWTAERVAWFIQEYGVAWQVKIVEAINSALAAARTAQAHDDRKHWKARVYGLEQQLAASGYYPEPYPKPTGEWTVEENDYGTTLNLHDGSGPVSLPIGRPWFVFATIMSDAHNAALAEARLEAHNYWSQAVDSAQQQLATERSLRETAQSNAELWHEEMLKADKQLAAEREKLAAAQVGNKAAKAFMDYLRTNTGVSDEWPIELMVAEDSIEPINTLLNQFEKSIYATDTDALDAYVEQQLAAEREKVAK